MLTDELLTVPNGKFESKFGVWQVIASNGLVDAVIIGGTMNADDYLKLGWLFRKF